MSRLKSLPALETQSMPQPIRSLKASSCPIGAREASNSVVSLAFRWATWGSSVSAIEEQTGQPADQSGPNMKW